MFFYRSQKHHRNKLLRSQCCVVVLVLNLTLHLATLTTFIRNWPYPSAVDMMFIFCFQDPYYRFINKMKKYGSFLWKGKQCFWFRWNSWLTKKYVMRLKLYESYPPIWPLVCRDIWFKYFTTDMWCLFIKMPCVWHKHKF